MKKRMFITKSFLMGLVLLVPLTVQCGGKKPLPPWPPSSNPTFDGLYPYDFAGQDVKNLKKMKRIITSGKYDKNKEDLYLFAFGRAMLDAILYASLLQPGARQKFLERLGNIMDIVDMKSMEDVFENNSFFKEPFFVLAKKYPKSTYAASAVEFNRILEILTSNQPTWMAIEPSYNIMAPSEYLSLGYQRDVAFSLKIFSVFESAASKNQIERTAYIIRNLLPYAFPNPEIGSNPDKFLKEKNLERFILEVLKPVASEVYKESDPVTYALTLVLEWIHGKLNPAMNGSDPLTPEIKHMLVKKYKFIKSTPLDSQVLVTFPLPVLTEAVEWKEGNFYPFTFITVNKDGLLRIATEPLLGFGKDGSNKVKNSKSPYLWPGKVIAKNISSISPKEKKQILKSLEAAEREVATLIPDNSYTNIKKGSTVGVAADAEMHVDKLLPLLKILRKRYDSVLLAASGSDHLVLVPAEIRPNCPGEGTRVTINLEKESIRLVDTSDISKNEKNLGAPFGKSPVKADVLANYVSTFSDFTKPLVYVESFYRGGVWTWEDMVKIHAAVAQMLDQLEGETYVYLLPELSMEETAEIEGEDISISDKPAKESMEAFVLKGCYSEIDESILDEKLSKYVSGLKLEDAVGVILNVARCWGGNYRVRAADALSKAEQDILVRIADYIGDESLNDVASSTLVQAGKNAAPLVVNKLRSPDESIWTSAWYILSNMVFTHIEPHFEKLLKDPDPEIKVRALKLLPEVGPPGGVAAIMDLIDDDDEIVRSWAVVTAGMLGMDEAKEKISSIAETGTENPQLLSDAIFSLGLLEAYDAVDLIIGYVTHPEAVVRSAVALSLGNMGLREENVKMTLLGLLEDSDQAVRVSAINALAVYGDADAAGMIEPFLEDSSAEVREAAEAALSSFEKMTGKGQKAAIDISAISEICEELGTEEILQIAGEEGKAVFKCLAKLTKNKDPEIRKAAVEALGARGDKKAESLLMKRTKDKIKAVRKAAWKALKQLGVYSGKKKKK